VRNTQQWQQSAWTTPLTFARNRPKMMKLILKEKDLSTTTVIWSQTDGQERAQNFRNPTRLNEHPLRGKLSKNVRKLCFFAKNGSSQTTVIEIFRLQYNLCWMNPIQIRRPILRQLSYSRKIDENTKRKWCKLSNRAGRKQSK
jgi:hypothetical protein